MKDHIDPDCLVCAAAARLRLNEDQAESLHELIQANVDACDAMCDLEEAGLDFEEIEKEVDAIMDSLSEEEIPPKHLLN